MTILEQLPNGGAVVALIAVVILFLKKQERTEDTLKAIVGSFTSEVSASRAEYREHVTGLMAQGLGAHKETRDAIRSLDEAIRLLSESSKPARKQG